MFVSFAQNYEDVMLWRALKEVENGFWIDIGAADPRDLNVTLAFHDRGWHGINIEPEPGYAAALRRHRPEDINLEVAVGAARGQAELIHIPGTGLSGFDREAVEGHRAAGYESAGTLTVEVRTLADICEEFAPDDIHFLKIDAEGSEGDIIGGADFESYRPWVIVVEATEAFSSTRTREDWLLDLKDAGYRECWFDGINAFFLAEEHHARLAPRFEAPPNFFDHFIRAEHADALARIGELETHHGSLQRENADLRTRRDELEARYARLAEENARLMNRASEFEAHRDRLAYENVALRNSTSWRITNPLRRVVSLIRR